MSEPYNLADAESEAAFYRSLSAGQLAERVKLATHTIMQCEAEIARCRAEQARALREHQPTLEGIDGA